MKAKILYLLLLIVAVMPLRSQYNPNIDSVNNVMEGKWIWKACYGGFSGECYDNPGQGNQRSVIFSKTDSDSMFFEVYKNDTLILSGITKFEYVVTEFINLWTIEKDVVRGEAELGMPGYYIINKIDSVSIEFAEPCVDCYFYKYERDDILTGVAVAGKKNKIFIYPNPVAGKLYVRNDNTIDELEIIDITGKVIFRKINNTGSKIIVIDISHIKSGAYFIRSVSAGKTCLDKFLKL